MMCSDFPRLPDPDFQQALDEALEQNIIKYRDGLILSKDNRFKWNFAWYDSLDLAKAAIDKKWNVLSFLKIDVIIAHKDGKETLLNEDQGKLQYMIGRSPWELYNNQQS
jgi:hypothetical protein